MISLFPYIEILLTYHCCVYLQARLKEAREAAKSRGSLRAIRDLWVELQRVAPGPADGPVHYVHRSGLVPFIEAVVAMAGMNKSPGVLIALAEHWWDTTHTFHMGIGEITITPTDYAAITGLRFDGDPLVWRDDFSDHDLETLLGFSPRPMTGLGKTLGRVEANIHVYFVCSMSRDGQMCGLGRLLVLSCGTLFVPLLFTNSVETARFALLQSLIDFRCDSYHFLGGGRAG